MQKVQTQRSKFISFGALYIVFINDNLKSFITPVSIFLDKGKIFAYTWIIANLSFLS